MQVLHGSHLSIGLLGVPGTSAAVQQQAWNI